MNIDNKVTIIEISAEYLCLIILGEKEVIESLIVDINKNNSVNIPSVQYTTVKINNPLANKCYELIKTLNDNINIDISDTSKNVIIDDGVETAQCYTYAEGYDNTLYMLMTLCEIDNKYVLGYPKIKLNNDDDPEVLMDEWFKKKIKKIPKGVKKNMKLITVVGTDSNILVVATKISNKIKQE